MQRAKLEVILDEIFGRRLMDFTFLDHCLAAARRRACADQSGLRIQRLSSQIETLREKRERVIETFLDGVLGREERDLRLASLDQEIQGIQDALIQESPCPNTTADALVEAFAPLAEWSHWSREQKRRLLAAMVPDVRVANYKVESLGLSTTLFSNEGARMGVGAFNLIRRGVYEAVGTYERLRLEVLDDMKLGKVVKKAGYRSATASVRI